MHGKYGIAGMLALAVMLALLALSGCISPEDILSVPGGGTEGTATPTPTGAALQGESGETGVIQSDITLAKDTTQYFLETPYGYIRTIPRTGVRLAIIEIKEEVDETGQKYLTGRIKNEENTRLNHVTVNFNLFNSNGNLVGNAHASVNSLNPGKVWMFTTNSFPSRNYQYYEMAEVFTV